tara:strand:- start:8762 stop:9004 length:243 start_codon:yes stop_codon:yes gene_type:complete
MTERFSNYELDDITIKPLLVNKMFDNKVHKQFLKETQPDVKPEQVFDGYKKIKKVKKKKVVRKSKRIKKKDDDLNKVSEN